MPRYPVSAALGLVLVLAVQPLLHAQDGLPDVTLLDISPALTFPLERMSLSLSTPVFVVAADELFFWDAVAPGASLARLPYAYAAGIDAHSVPSRLGLSILALPASGTVYTVEGIRVFSDRDAIGTNLNFIPLSLFERMEVVVGPASDFAGSGPLAGMVNAVLPGGRPSPATGYSGALSSVIGTDHRTGSSFKVANSSHDWS
ncbi:MAG TPA: hypothetical protein ENN09_01245, partial [Planctomycetes bacterium]|nr:hypothetical protein [Planctomycetota bacterium]